MQFSGKEIRRHPSAMQAASEEKRRRASFVVTDPGARDTCGNSRA